DCLWGPSTGATKSRVIEARLLHGGLPCPEQSIASFVKRYRNVPFSETAARTTTPANFYEHLSSRPVLPTPIPKVLLCHSDLLPRYGAHGRLEPEFAFVVEDWMLTFAAVGFSQMRHRDCPKILSAVFAGHGVGGSRHDR